MDIEKLNSLILNPVAAQASDQEVLEEIAREYPFFQGAKLLLAKALQTPEAIKSAAVCTSHRPILHQILNKKFDANMKITEMKDLHIESNPVNAFEAFSEEPSQTAEDVDTKDADTDTDPENVSSPTDSTEEQDTTAYSNSLQEDLYFGTDEEEYPSNEGDEDTEDRPVSLFEERDEPATEGNVDHRIEQEESLLQEPVSEIPYEYPEFETPSFLDEAKSSVQVQEEEQSSEIFQEQEDRTHEDIFASLEALKKLREDSSESEDKKDETTKDEQNVAFEEPTYEHPDYASNDELNKDLSENTRGEETILNENEDEETEHEMESYFEIDTSAFILDDLLKKEEDSSISSPLGWKKQQPLIDQFIEKEENIKIKPNSNYSEDYEQTDLAAHSSTHNNAAISENLALIFIKQGKIHQAIDIYQRLILKNPDKKSYFAARIEELKKEL
ncbi:hypothetical protein AAG747_14815 [Rapidithrix thailandica]|uniref:Tetratricopeptide repeat protein n=1 Tax=Rapidithrix thailandica TaxID=413964 RepID=A0AAW9S9R3_9BACT